MQNSEQLFWMRPNSEVWYWAAEVSDKGYKVSTWCMAMIVVIRIISHSVWYEAQVGEKGIDACEIKT